jgi:glutamate racemase
VILIACNSASAAAYELIRDYCGSRAKVFDVINPMVNRILTQYENGHVGLIGTKQTVGSGVYASRIQAGNRNITFSALATPLLVPMIEEHFFHNQISHDIIGQYFRAPELTEIETLILGCTHYPIIHKEMETIWEEMGRKVAMVDSAETVALALRDYLEENGLANAMGGDDHFLVSDFTPSFEKAARMFFGEKIKLEKYQLWE